MNPIYLMTLCVCGLLLSSPLYAWSNDFRFINNFNTPMTLTITPTLAVVSSTCGMQNVNVLPHSPSCKFEFNIAKKNWHATPGNSGTITLAKKTDPASYCVYNYHYTYQTVPYSYFNIHSENISLQSCHGNLKPMEISVISDKTQALGRPLVGDIFLNLDKEKAAKSTESFSEADCGTDGGDNCMIASPDLNTLYVNDGSTLAESIALQNQLDRYEPLNFEQFLGSHNSAASRHYTTSSNHYNMSYSDPDNYLTLTDQLNMGVRQIELDLVWFDNTITICHNHVSAKLEEILCDSNSPLSATLTEIKTWIEKNPHAALIIYLDVNLPLAGKVTNLDADLAKLEPYIFTPELAAHYYGVTDQSLPAYQLSSHDLTEKLQKNIIVVNDNDINNLQNSKYVFTKVQHSKQTPLYETGVHDFLAMQSLSCNSSGKYDKVKSLYQDDADHYNILRMNGNRTALDYAVAIGNKNPDEFVNYYTTLNLPDMLNCPINVFSANMLGYTCDSTQCNSHPTDPRLYAFLWSWELGYPRNQSGGQIAYIDPQTKHFKNDPLIPNSIYAVLCYQKSSAQKTPTAPLQWYVRNVQITDPSTAFNTAQTACQTTGGLFAAPTTAYWMNDAMNVINANGSAPYNVLVNYQYINNEWTPNVKMEEETGKNILVGQSLIQ